MNNKIVRNRDIQEQLQGLVQKKTWSMLFQRGEMYISDVVKKGYQEQSVKKAMKKLVEIGAATTVEGKRNCFAVNGVTK